MTTPGWAERAVAKKLGGQYMTLSPKLTAELLKAEHARGVRACKKLEKQALAKQEPDCTRCYVQGVRDVLAALQRGRQ